MRPTKLVFVVPTTDLQASIEFYRDGLGLELTEEWDDMGRGAILHGGALPRSSCSRWSGVVDVAEPRTTLGLQVLPEDVDRIYGRLEAGRARLKGAPRIRAWGMRGFGAFDPNGVPVNVYAPSSRDVSERPSR